MKNQFYIQSFDSIQTFINVLKPTLKQAPHSLAAVDFPFTQTEFLEALETSGCLGPRTGWAPCILTAWQDSQVLAALVLFLKTNSYGEYIFDFAWAQAHESYGYDYYPKLVSAVPFTPATGSKLLFHESLLQENTTAKEMKQAVTTALYEAAKKSAEGSLCSSLHALFITKAEIPALQAAGYMIRHSYQFHWQNQNYTSFSDFLSRLRSKRRREILRERIQVQKLGVNIQRLTGEQLTPEHAEWMYDFYLSTVQKMGGYNYLTRDFFRLVFSSMKDHVLFVLATDARGRPVAGALNFFGQNTLYGRNWGCLEEYRALHFELCYYQGIEFAIERKFILFEAGAQGEHKFQRGFLPTLTYSAHWIQERRLSAAIRDFIEREKIQIEHLFEDYYSHNPFQRGSDNTMAVKSQGEIDP